MIQLGLHYFNIYDYISDLVNMFNVDEKYIYYEGIHIRQMVNNPEYELIILSNDHSFIKKFVDKHGSETEIERLEEFYKTTNLKIIDSDITSNFIFGIYNYCETHGIKCMATKSMIHEHVIKLSKHCRNYIHRYNIPATYNKIIIDTNIVLFYIMEINNPIAKLLFDFVLKGKEILIVKEVSTKVEAYVYLHGNSKTIDRMNDYFESVTIIDNYKKYISKNILDKETNEENIINAYEDYKYEYVADKLNNKENIFTKSITISNSLNIPFMISEARYYNFMSRFIKSESPLVICYNKIDLGI